MGSKESNQTKQTNQAIYSKMATQKRKIKDVA